MCAIKLKLRTNIVFEIPEQPVDRVMAVATSCTQGFFMRVICTMAIDTTTKGIFESWCFVAATAFSIDMSPDQWKHGQAMVEENFSRPALLVVTTATLLAKLTFMLIVRLMARQAVSSRVRLMHRRDMAIDTAGVAMQSEQWEVGVPVM